MLKIVDDKVTIITPTYNSEKFISETIESVLRQSYHNFEMIIIDDNSQDNTIEIVKKYQEKDDRILLFELNENCGAALARNFGLEKASGQYIAFLDSDDLWDFNKLEKQLEYMKTKNIGFSFSSYRLISESGKSLNKVVKVPTTIKYEQLLGNTIIGCLTVIIDRKIIGDFRMPLIRAGQDTATWLLLLRENEKAYGYQEILASYRKVNGSISSNKIKALKRTWNIYRNVEKLTLFKSITYFILYLKNALLKRL